jgi:hypothetical protein
MADYIVTPDDYAGWNPTGRNFAYISAAIGGVGLLSWLALHGRLGAFRPTATADQMFLGALVWVGVGASVLMLIAAFGSISLSLKARGSVGITSEGVTRVVGKNTYSLAWTEIEGFVPMPQGGVTLVPNVEKPSILIPRFLDDYRACIAEIKDHGLQFLPPSRLRATRRKTTWLQTAAVFSGTFFYLSAIDPHHSHRIRVLFLCAAATVLLSLAYRDTTVKGERPSVWLMIFPVCGLILWVIWRMAHSW